MSRQSNRFTDKVVVVLGGNSGIGKASALAFADEGARVVVTGRNQDTLDEVAQLLGERGRCVRSDIGDLAAIRQLMAEIGETEGRIDVLFVNAGTGAFRPLDDVDEEFYDAIIQVNLKGPYFAVRHASPLLREGASVILTSSMGHCKGIPGNSVYAASKAGLRALARNFGVELVQRGIRVNCFSPGPIDTPLITRGEMSSEQIDGFRKMIEDTSPMGRFGTPEEAADAVLFLASDQSTYITGIDLLVDGGAVSF
ncbi:MAG: SDR family oxidoreductase [Novosphingobium sp.]|nr:SDR family oxidoreductase [Novosphingobium sp.]